MEEIKGVTELCEIAFKYGADKCPQINHMYTPFYYDYFSPMRQTVKKVFEFGIGNRRIKYAIPHYQMGASLRMWRDFFPNAQVYGADYAKGSVFSDERITTYYANEDIKEDIEGLVEKIGSDIDIVIDDASHHVAQQIFLFKTLMPLLQKGVIYVIEDCGRTRVLSKMFPEYDSCVPRLLPNLRPKASDGIIIFTNK
jgi:8-demethyl-8-alpha-L-rhamnosyltetracenomycin-C 2'-O-methyltransferase